VGCATDGAGPRRPAGSRAGAIRVLPSSTALRPPGPRTIAGIRGVLGPSAALHTGLCVRAARNRRWTTALITQRAPSALPRRRRAGRVEVVRQNRQPGLYRDIRIGSQVSRSGTPRAVGRIPPLGVDDSRTKGPRVDQERRPSSQAQPRRFPGRGIRQRVKRRGGNPTEGRESSPGMAAPVTRMAARLPVRRDHHDGHGVGQARLSECSVRRGAEAGPGFQRKRRGHRGKMKQSGQRGGMTNYLMKRKAAALLSPM